MGTTSLLQIEQSIARCRLILSVAALVALYVDPTVPLLSRWIPLVSGPFMMDPYLLAVMAAHLAYSLTVYLVSLRGWVVPARIAAWTMCSDVVFAAAIAVLTEGITSPFYVFFAFAVAVVGFRTGLRPAMVVTGVSVALYVCILFVSAGRLANVYIMRPVYLAIIGYLVGYLGQHRLDLQEQVAELEAARQRHLIGRDLHDGFMQALAGITLKIEGCRRFLRVNAVADALNDLTELQESVNCEYDELRGYMRSLAGIEVTPRSQHPPADARLSLSANLSGTIEMVDHVLQIVREGIANIRQHARAQAATVQVCCAQSEVRITIEDNGVGFRRDASPWSIASRVKQIGGELQVKHDHGPGAHLSITLPLR